MRTTLVITLFFIFAVTAAAAIAKDKQRVTLNKGNPAISLSIQACQNVTMVKQRKQRTVAHKKQWDCHYLPAFLQPTLRLSWSNIFREMSRARDCGVPAFTYKRCRG